MAGIYNGHLLEFPSIRVDCFLPTSPSLLLPSPATSASSSKSSLSLPFVHTAVPAPNAQLFLLTHVHSDHLLGLNDNFTGKIICSHDTKRMLLSLEPEVERGRMENGVRESRRLKYAGLKRRLEGKGKDERYVDMIEAVPYGLPKEHEIGYEDGKPQRVTITLLDANHCPGSTMFLITSPQKAVLHSGDIRADRLFIQNLKREPALQQFVMPTSTNSSPVDQARGGRRILDRIYLDTSAVLGTGDMPDREPVLQDLVEQMGLFPPDTIFFLDTWCFGWEFVIKEVSRYFGEPIHIDRYKRSIYTAIESDPYLLSCTTADPNATRFHACERIAKCTACRRFAKGNSKPVYNLDKRIVSVNMVEVKEASWALQHDSFLESLGKAAIGEGSWPYNINVPLARHSPLPELQNLVRLFRPKAISPNTVVPALKGMDFYLLPDFLKDSISESAYQGMVAERDQYFEQKYGSAFSRDLERTRTIGLDSGKVMELNLRSLGGSNNVPPGLQNMVEIFGNSNIVRNSSRKAMAQDQMVRASGMTSLPHEEIMQMLLGGSVQSRASAVDYDTDEETPRNKRRRREYIKEESGSLVPEPSPHGALADSEAAPALVSTRLQRYAVAAEGGTQVKTETKVDIVSEEKVKIGAESDRSTSQYAKRIKRDKKPSRFSLGADEKERIKALMARDRILLADVGGDGDDEEE